MGSTGNEQAQCVCEWLVVQHVQPRVPRRAACALCVLQSSVSQKTLYLRLRHKLRPFSFVHNDPFFTKAILALPEELRLSPTVHRLDDPLLVKALIERDHSFITSQRISPWILVIGGHRSPLLRMLRSASRQVSVLLFFFFFSH